MTCPDARFKSGRDDRVECGLVSCPATGQSRRNARRMSLRNPRPRPPRRQARADLGLRQDRHRRVRRARSPRTASRSSRPAAPRKRLREAGLAGDRRLRRHRLSRDDGRAREDAASADPRRAAGAARRCRRIADAMEDARHRARSTASSSISTRSRRRWRVGADRGEAIENIDIGGPAMIRAAAKNHACVAVVTDPADYAAIAECAASEGGSLSLELPQRLAAKAFARTAAYDAAISGWFADALGRASCRSADRSPAGCASGCATARTRTRRPRFYLDRRARRRRRHGTPGAGQGALLQQHQRHRRRLRAGRRVRSASMPPSPSSSTPIPAASAIGGDARWRPTTRRSRCDPVSAFGGIVAVNRALDAEGGARRSPRSSPRSSSRRMRTKRGVAVFAEEESAPAR